MPRRSKPTLRQERLGAELRKLREGAGITTGEAAQTAGMRQSDLSNVEAGRQAVSAERVGALAAHYGVTDTALVDALAAMTGRRQRGWWEQYRGTVGDPLLDLAELEHHARALRLYEVMHIPGLFQTAEHSCALFANAPYQVSRELVEVLTEFRQKRRHVLDRDDSPEVSVVIHEAALRIMVGDRGVARRQLELLLQESDRSTVSMRVIPFAREGFSGGFSMLYAEASVRQLDTAHFDIVHGSVFVDAEEELLRHREAFRAWLGVALSEDESRDLINNITREL